MTMRDMEFLARMDGDTDERRRTAFIAALSACDASKTVYIQVGALCGAPSMKRFNAMSPYRYSFTCIGSHAYYT